jgi:DNA adenine methylase
LQYFGGKKRISKQLCEFLNKQTNKQFEYYFEPFVGSCAIIENIEHPIRYGNDANKYLIEMYKALQHGWIPPCLITEEEYKYLKSNKDIDKKLSGFAGIACSYSGKWFDTYARNKSGRNYALNAHNTLLKSLPKIQKIVFSSRLYQDCHPKDALIYCDPPYSNVGNGYCIDTFDSDEFWEIIREWSKNNKVFISEYIAPDDFECVLEIETRTDLRNKEGKMIPRTERVFTLTQ